MKQIPYFLSLLKSNVLLWTIITTNSLTSINLEGTNHGYWSTQCLEFRDYPLNKNEKFKSVRITDNESFMMFDFYTDSDQYLQHSNYYFGPALKDQETSAVKRFEKFDIGLDKPIDMEIINYGKGYGTVISITVYKEK
ncbi:hypothetical protein SAMN04488511_103193 [Pedobacter suwonensis]|uniref:Uncharacterized protein n=1 Tax=Pedobacter suwonensis TaxID=332999 RepID=A0A1I0STP8_9SPHI|nr:hypothetical protein [Pedobacter suwonensis]SFA42895.1 hypothetical protein SAMN04488511_103193 [Pedobacter suwonensis]